MSRHCYIAGRMRGLPRFGFDAFHAAAADLRSRGWRVTSPAEMDEQLGFDPDQPLPADFDLADAMKRDIEAILRCDTLILLPGWEESEGAKIELTVAQAIGLDIRRYIRDEGQDCYYLLPLEDVGKPESVCHEADRLVSEDRGAVYGPPEVDFARTGRIWGAVLGVPDIPPEKVGLCMVGLKMSRLVQTPDHRDSIVDMAGYSKCLDLIRRAK